MLGRYQVYPEYKDSGVEWLGNIPKGWKALPLKFATMNRVKDGPHETPKFIDEGIPFFSVDSIQNNKLIFENCRYISIKDHIRFSLKCIPQEGDVLLGKAASVGKVAYVDSQQEFNIWSPLAVISPKNKSQGKFIFYSLQSTWLQAQCETLSNSNTQKNLSMQTIDNIMLALPSVGVTNRIIDFLDHETAKIDTLIQKQQQLIQLLKEKRQVVISHAVTKGLNPDVPMKDSGVEWLGEVPEGWICSTLKRYVHVVDCKHITAEFFDEGIPLASIGEVKEWFINLDKAKLTNEKYYFDLIEGGREPQPGDIIYSRNATVGEAALVAGNMPSFAMGQDVCLIRLNDNVLPEFVLFVLKSGVIFQQLELAMVGSTFKRINVDDIRNFIIAFPLFNEQKKVVKKITHSIKKHDVLIAKALSAIDLMIERRTTIISAAVTGKIDVRNWQPPKESIQSDQTQTNKEKSL